MVEIYMCASRLQLLVSGVAMCVRACVWVGWGLRFLGVFSHHQRRQACVRVCQRGGRMRNSLGVRGARVYVLFVFVRSFGLLTALAGAPLLAWLLGLLGLSCRRSRGSRFVLLAICVHLKFLVLLVLLV